MTQIFQYQAASPFTERESIPALVKWNRQFSTITIRTKQTGATEPAERLNRELVNATCQDNCRPSLQYQVGGVTNSADP
jgi:hypothetical protein